MLKNEVCSCLTGDDTKRLGPSSFIIPRSVYYSPRKEEFPVRIKDLNSEVDTIIFIWVRCRPILTLRCIFVLLGSRPERKLHHPPLYMCYKCLKKMFLMLHRLNLYFQCIFGHEKCIFRTRVQSESLIVNSDCENETLCLVDKTDHVFIRQNDAIVRS